VLTSWKKDRRGPSKSREDRDVHSVVTMLGKYIEEMWSLEVGKYIEEG
jgi:hypothetical protein